MVILIKLATLLLAILIVIAISSIFASHVPNESNAMELVGSSNFTDPKVHTKRQSAYKKVYSPLRDQRDTKLYLDENDRDTYLDRTSQQTDLNSEMQNYTSGSNTAPIYRSHHHHSHHGNYYTIPGTGYGYSTPGGSSAGVGHSMISGFGNPFAGFGGVGGGMGNHGYGGGSVVGHSFSVLDPLFLMITLSFILFLVNSILGIVDRIKLPVVRARSADGIPIQSDLGIEIIDSLIYEIRASLDKYGYEHRQNQRIKEN